MLNRFVARKGGKLLPRHCLRQAGQDVAADRVIEPVGGTELIDTNRTLPASAAVALLGEHARQLVAQIPFTAGQGVAVALVQRANGGA